jgi:hypothetical protein
MKKQRGYLIDMKRIMRIKRLKSRIFHFSRVTLIFIIMFSWVFSGFPQFWGIPPSPQFAFAQQFGRPNADDGSVGTWNGSYTDINDSTSDDTTYIETSSHAPTVGDYFQVSISNLDDPNTDDDHIVRYRYGRSASGGRDFGIEVGLYQGTTLISSWTHSTVPATPITQAQTLSTTEAGNITDYENLSVRFTIDNVGAGQPRTPRWYWAEVEVPDVVAGSPPTLLTHSPTDVDQTSVTGQGEITDDGGGSVTSRGFVWSTTNQSDPGNTSPNDSDYENNVSQSGNYATGTYSLSISGLDPGETYYYRAFAENSEGYAYGDEESFTTDPEAPTVVTNSVSNIEQTSAIGQGEITDTGGESADERGFVWGDTSLANPGNTAPGSTSYDDFVSASGTFGVEAFSLTLSSLTKDTTYYYRAYAKNSAGYSYGSEVEFSTLGDFPVVNTLSPNNIATSSVSGRGDITDIGADNATERGFVWSTTSRGNPSNTAPASTSYDDFVSATGTFGTGQFTLPVTSLDSNTTYYYRAYAQNSEGYAYGPEVEFSTDDEYPVVTTASPFDVLTRQVTGSGSVTDDKGLTISERGFVWGDTSLADPGNTAPGSTSYDDFVSATGTFGVDSFSLDISGLDPNTTYYYRAYALNSEGYAYGNQISFTTATAQFSRPSSDQSTGTWQPTPLYENINSTSRSDSSYIYSDNNTSPDTAEIHLSDVDDPGVSTGHILRYTYRKDNTGGHTINFRMRLLDGTTEIASWLHSDITNSYILAEQTLTETQAGNITNYTDLRIEVSREGDTGGGPTTHRAVEVSWVEFELPEAPEINPPIVTTSQATDIDVTEATGQGNVTNTGGLNITERGFVWGSTGQADPGNTAPGSTSYDDFVSATGTFGSGSFSSVISGLDPETTYFYRAYAYNSEGYSYGSEVAFQTYAEEPTVSTKLATGITGSQANGQGEIVFSGSSTPSERGFVWSTTSYPTNPGNVSPTSSEYENLVNETGTYGTGNFSLTMSSLDSDTVYFYRAYARNEEGYGYGEEKEFQTAGNFVNITTDSPTGIATTTVEGQGEIVNVGVSNPTERGFVWSTVSQSNPGNTAPGESTYGSVASSTGTFGTGTFSLTLSDLEEGTVYYYRAYAMNSAGYSYGNEVTFYTLSTRPTLLTKDPTDLTFESVVGQAEIVDIGNAEATYRGFVYGTTTQSNPGNTPPGASGYDTNTGQSGNFNTGNFQITLSSLNDNTTYYYRAFAENSEGYGYGNEIEFTTPQEPFPPELSSIELNNTGNIYLVEGSTTTVSVSATVTDPNGWEDIEESMLEGVVYRSGVGSSNVVNLNNSYLVDNLSLENCSGNSCDITGSVSMWYFAEPTDEGDYSLEHWEFWVYVEDSYGYSDKGVSQAHPVDGSIDVMTLLAIWVDIDEIDYGQFEMGEDSGPDNVQTVIRNTGNSAVSIEVSGQNMQLEPGSEIAVNNQQWASAAFSYGSGNQLSDVDVSTMIELSKPTSTTPIEDSIFWGIGIPEASLRTGRYKGVNNFIAVPVE